MTAPIPAPADDGAAAHLTAGTAMPDVALTATTGDAVSLAGIAGRAVVFVYPWTGRPGVANPPGWDDIPGAHGSTPEAEGFRDCHASFVAHRTCVFGLSAQATDWQQELAARLGLPFPLLSDDGYRLADALRLPSFETGGVRYLKRLTLVIDHGRLVRTVYPVHPPPTHAAQLLTEL